MSRSHVRRRIVLPAIILVSVGVIALIIVALASPHHSSASVASSASSTAAPALASTTASTIVVSAAPSTAVTSATAETPSTISTDSSTPSITPLPQGTVTPVPTPSGATAEGYTSGDLSTGDNAPKYSTTISTATVSQHWGFSYTFQCDPATTDTFRQGQSTSNSFTVQLDGSYLLSASTYQGSGFVEVHSSSGPRTHDLVVTGPCSYELDYVDFAN